MAATKRKFQVTDFQDEPPYAKRSNIGQNPNPHAQTDRPYNGQNPKVGWCSSTSWGYPAMGNSNNPQSLPLNMVSEMQPEFDSRADDRVVPDLNTEPEPLFLKPLSSRLTPDVIETLKAQGALDIPGTELRNELLKCYVRWVHNFMPVLDLQEFLRCIAENDPNGNVSLLLFQAVMFVGTAFVDMKFLRAAGYETRKGARNALHSRLKLLFSYDCEDDGLVILQAALLVTNWFEYGRESSTEGDIWDWIGICNSHGQSIGLNINPARFDLDPRIKRLRIRLWWSLYTRDRLVALGMRRPTQVDERTSDVPMLTMADFDIEPFRPSVATMLGCRQLIDASHQKRLAMMFIELVKLCQCIGRVLSVQYSTSQCLIGESDRTTLIPRQASESELAQCSEELDSWLGGLSEDAQFTPPSAEEVNEGDDVLLHHSGMLKMLHHATSCALHKPSAATMSGNQDSTVSKDNRLSKSDATTTTGISQIIRALNQMGLSKFLSQTDQTITLPAAVSHLTKPISNSNNNNPDARNKGMNSLHRCVQILRQLQSSNPASATDADVAHLDAAIKSQFGSGDNFLRFLQGLRVFPSNSACRALPQGESEGSPAITPVEDVEDCEEVEPTSNQNQTLPDYTSQRTHNTIYSPQTPPSTEMDVDQDLDTNSNPPSATNANTNTNTNTNAETETETEAGMDLDSIWPTDNPSQTGPATTTTTIDPNATNTSPSPTSTGTLQNSNNPTNYNNNNNYDLGLPISSTPTPTPTPTTTSNPTATATATTTTTAPNPYNNHLNNQYGNQFGYGFFPPFHKDEYDDPVSVFFGSDTCNNGGGFGCAPGGPVLGPGPGSYPGPVGDLGFVNVSSAGGWG